MSTDIKAFLDDISSRAEHLETALCGGLTKDGCIFLSTPKNMTIKTLKGIRKMINEQIKDRQDGSY